MSKQKDSSRGDKTDQADALPWSPRVRGIVSLLLAFHVAAVFIAPWSGPPPASGLSQRASAWVRPYVDTLSINNGYRFFAPIPGPSHIVRYRMQLRDGSIKEGQFPDLDEQWPRLLYHRYLMLAERVHVFLVDPPVPPQQTHGYSQLTPRQQQQRHAEFQMQGRRYSESRTPLLALVEPVAQRMMLDHDADKIDLWSVEHSLPTPHETLSGPPADDNWYYVERFVGSFERQ